MRTVMKRTAVAARKPDLFHVYGRALVQTFLVIKLLAVFIQRDTFILRELMMVCFDVIYGRANNTSLRTVVFILGVRVDSQMPRVASEFLHEENQT